MDSRRPRVGTWTQDADLCCCSFFLWFGVGGWPCCNFLYCMRCLAGAQLVPKSQSVHKRCCQSHQPKRLQVHRQSGNTRVDSCTHPQGKKPHSPGRNFIQVNACCKTSILPTSLNTTSAMTSTQQALSTRNPILQTMMAHKGRTALRPRKLYKINQQPVGSIGVILLNTFGSRQWQSQARAHSLKRGQFLNIILEAAGSETVPCMAVCFKLRVLFVGCGWPSNESPSILGLS